MTYHIAVIPGDGIGPEIVSAAREVLAAIGARFGHTFHFEELAAGGNAIDSAGIPLPAETLEKCLQSDSVLLGAVGGPQWDKLPGHLRPERALLGLRKGLELFANLRPAKLLPALRDACPLRGSAAETGFDLLIVRELTGGLYFGPSGRQGEGDSLQAFDTEIYSRREIERIGHVAFRAAMSRRKLLASVDKANVMESSRLWRETIHALAPQYPEVTVKDVLVDNCAMQLIANPAQFDVIVTSNLFGDILSDEASQLTGSIGMLPSASLGASSRGLYEPIHGSAPDIAGQGIANPIATILSTAMMLSMSFGLAAEAAAIERAVEQALATDARTKDIARGGPWVSGRKMTDIILGNVG
jgi:3-isopropylmalate dehydrogenase